MKNSPLQFRYLGMPFASIDIERAKLEPIEEARVHPLEFKHANETEVIELQKLRAQRLMEIISENPEINSEPDVSLLTIREYCRPFNREILECIFQGKGINKLPAFLLDSMINKSPLDENKLIEFWLNHPGLYQRYENDISKDKNVFSHRLLAFMSMMISILGSPQCLPFTFAYWIYVLNNKKGSNNFWLNISTHGDVTHPDFIRSRSQIFLNNTLEDYKLFMHCCQIIETLPAGDEAIEFIKMVSKEQNLEEQYVTGNHLKYQLLIPSK